MIAVKSKITNKGISFADMHTFRKIIRDYAEASVSIGFHDDAGQYPGAGAPSVVEVALWNEFGTHTSPERSFLRTAIDENSSKINKWREEAITSLVDEFIKKKGKIAENSIRKALEKIGFNIQVLVQNKIKSNVPPPNAESTAMAKDRAGVAAVTLIDTGLMLRSVTYRVNLKRG